MSAALLATTALTPAAVVAVRHLSLDLETRSPVDLIACGVYVYAEDPNTDIIVASYKIDDGPEKTWYMIWGQTIPADLEQAFLDPNCLIHAHNANFERVMMLMVAVRRGYVSAAVAKALMVISRWRCSAACAAYFGLPRTLEQAAAALGLDQQKDMAGSQLMKSMCGPIRRHMDGTYGYKEDPESVYRLGLYCEQDVRTEYEERLSLPDLPDDEQAVWEMTERMNDRGIIADPALLDKMPDFVVTAEAAAGRALSEATNGHVPKVTSVPKLKEWLAEQGFPEVEETGLGKDIIQEMLENPELPDLIREVLVIRREGGKSSASKYKKILGRRNGDNRCRGSIIYCGASASSRYSSRGLQLQNLPRGGTIKKIEAAVADILNGAGPEDIRAKYGPPMVVASEIIRPTFISREGHWLARGDYSQVEMRMGAYFGGQEDTLQAFQDYDTVIGVDDEGKPVRKGPDLYRLTAAAVLSVLRSLEVTIEEITDDERQTFGKVPALACSFQGSVGAFQAMARVYQVKISDDDAARITMAWRDRNPGIKQNWKDTEKAAIACMRGPVGERHYVREGLWFIRGQQAMMMRKPSGRVITYWRPFMRRTETAFGDKESLWYWSIDSKTHQWRPAPTYGGKLVNNAVQSTARDIMADALLRLDADNLRPVLTVHDEAVCEIPKSRYPTTSEACEAVRAHMAVVPEWTPGLPLAVDCSAGPRYVKA